MSKLRLLNKEFVSNLKTHQINTDAKRNLILSILKSTTTKREARNYLNKYLNQFDFSDISLRNTLNASDLTVKENQRELFINRYLAKQNPFVNIYDEHETKLTKVPLRLAIFKIKFTSIKSTSWYNIRESFKRLVQLGVSPIILLDYDHLPTKVFKNNELYMINQVNKIMTYLNSPDDDLPKTTVLRSLFSLKNDIPCINGLEQILIPLYQGIVPIVQPIVYNTQSSIQEFLSCDKLLYGLCQSLLDSNDLLSIEKVVFVDPNGGIPSIERNQTSHVFINLSQEYADIVSELYIGFIKPKVRDIHLKNLHSMNDILNMIASKSNSNDATGIITTPRVLSINNDQMNPIIYNVLTDRPIISSSLPSSSSRTPELTTSIIKKGIPVEVFDKDSFSGEFTLENLFKQKFVDREKLVELINDSFGKPLKEDEYFARINDKLATLVILGDYDGLAIITWEGDDRVAYLDKFAIAKKNQGLPGLADIIFKIILQSHPQELIWRSRKNNPVNKWYFERCCGSMTPQDSSWRVFYTGELFNKKIDRTKQKKPDVFNISRKVDAYTTICESIPPSFSQ